MRKTMMFGLMPKILASGVVALLLSGAANAGGFGFDGNNWGHYDNDCKKKRHCAAVEAPEIDSSSAGAALILLGGGLVVLFGRRTVRKD
ncbi:MAG: hypothetical protein ACHQIL_07395 [Steroidobacterales bacterium]